jgi:cysteinyl-tRNA synthetase
LLRQQQKCRHQFPQLRRDAAKPPACIAAILRRLHGKCIGLQRLSVGLCCYGPQGIPYFYALMSELQLYNSLTRQKEVFTPITPGHVGLYVCGPTVSGESHLGHARPYITFDVVCRYLRHLGYHVRYVRNITDAGHFEEEGREAIDKVGEKAKLEKLEPMEMVHKYTSLFHLGMRLFNNLEPSIEPTATGHIIEQQSMIEDIMQKGYAYEVNGSVYFDVKKYAEHYPYGELSGRKIDELLETTRELEGQEEKRNKVDFALWKSAPPQHIQRWQSPWGEGFPGWHIECSAMSAKYLGNTFDIHGGGMDLLFPHHESEIAQSTIAHGHAPVRYWMHNNMITINGKKMGKSYNNVIKLTELFSGDHPMLEQPYHPMVVRFYILQTHYRSTLDFSNEALQASEKALRRLWEAYEGLRSLPSAPSEGGGAPNASDSRSSAPDSLPPAPFEGGGEGYEEAEQLHGLQMADKALYGKLKEYARQMRKEPTKAEQILWEALRRKGLAGFKFRRQHIIGYYIADLVCLPKRFIIEIDGLIHTLPEISDTDAERTQWLKEQGFEVFRVTNDAVLNNLDQVLEQISQRLQARPDAVANSNTYKYPQAHISATSAPSASSATSPSNGGGRGEAVPAGAIQQETAPAGDPDIKVRALLAELDDFMNDDFNTAKVIANLFEIVPIINGIKGGQLKPDALSADTLALLKTSFKTWLEDILGLQGLQPAADNSKLDKAIAILSDIRREARTRKDFATSDAIRNKLGEAGILLKDEKDGSVSYTLA